MACPDKLPARQDGQMAYPFELQQGALQRCFLHVGAGGRNFKRRWGATGGREQLWGASGASPDA